MESESTVVQAGRPVCGRLGLQMDVRWSFNRFHPSRNTANAHDRLDRQRNRRPRQPRLVVRTPRRLGDCYDPGVVRRMVATAVSGLDPRDATSRSAGVVAKLEAALRGQRTEFQRSSYPLSRKMSGSSWDAEPLMGGINDRLQGVTNVLANGDGKSGHGLLLPGNRIAGSQMTVEEDGVRDGTLHMRFESRGVYASSFSFSNDRGFGKLREKLFSSICRRWICFFRPSSCQAERLSPSAGARSFSCPACRRPSS